MTARSNPAELGSLAAARELLAREAFLEAWRGAVAAIQARPFHPPAFLLLAEIAKAAGDASTAWRCLERARSMAPNWPPLKAVAVENGGAPKDWPELETILAQRPLDRLSVCLIAKNEEAFLGQCLASVRDIAFEINVVDTGSKDRTVEIARENGATVVEFPWIDDFSAARNAGLVLARGDWILVLDADEELTAEAREELRRDMLNPKAAAYYLSLINKGREAEGATPLARMFRNLPGATYEGRIHEQVFGTVMSAARGWGLEYPRSRAVILHHGYSAEITANRDKVQRNLRLLQQAVHEPGATPLARANLWMNLGLENVRAGQLEAGIGHYRTALELAQAQLKAGNRPSPELRATLLRQLSTHLVGARRYAEILELFATPLAAAGPLGASDHYAWGLACMETGRLEDAVAHFRACLATRDQPDTIAVNTGIFTTNPHHCLALALARLNRRAEAEKTCADALAQFPDSQELAIFRAKLIHHQGRSVDALKALNQMLARWGANPEIWILGGEIALSQPAFYELALDWTAEAAKTHPGHPGILAQRIESLLLAGATDEALAVPRMIAEGQDARGRAAICFAAALAGDPGAPPPDEAKVSQAFLDLYRRLIAANAADPLRRMNQQLDRLEGVLPTAARLLKAATKT